jgi:hypothetical protein
MLIHRIAGMGGNQTRAEAGYLPAALPPGTQIESPVWQIDYHPVTNMYPWGETGSLTYQETVPIWAADQGGIIAATTPGPWGHVYAAGRP